MTIRCVVIIPAAGTGRRFDSEIPKQYLPLRGKPVLLHSLGRFLSDPRVEQVIVAASREHHGRIREMIPPSESRVSLVEGGSTRQESVASALRCIEPNWDGLVAVHDSVRPFFSAEMFEALLAAANESGAAIPAVAVTDTIHRVEAGVIRESPDRDELVAAQTPQCFRISILREVLERASREGITGTDEAGLAARFGHAVRVVEGSPSNFKITSREDLSLADAHFDQWSVPR